MLLLYLVKSIVLTFCLVVIMTTSGVCATCEKGYGGELCTKCPTTYDADELTDAYNGIVAMPACIDLIVT